MKLVSINEKNIKGNELFLIGLGDIHMGSTELRMNKLKRSIDWIKQSDNARTILMGDLVDMGLKDSIGGGVFDNNMYPEEQFETIIKLLKPIRKKIWGMLSGNHEERMRERVGFNVGKMIAKELDVPYGGPSCFFKALIGEQNYIIHAAHGSTGSTTPSGKLNAVMRYNTFNDADIYMMGHVHELIHTSKEYFRVDNRGRTVIKDKRHYVVTGHFLKYGGYAQQKGYAPGKTGVAKIILRKDIKKINVSI